jgi:hypothetical protein
MGIANEVCVVVASHAFRSQWLGGACVELTGDCLKHG